MVLAGLLCMLGALQVLAVDIYVSTNGSDDNDGSTIDDTFRTIERAQTAVRELASDSMTEDITVHVSPGIYALSAPLRFDATDSGKNDFTVTWVGDSAIVSGGLELHDWEAGPDGVYSASVPPGTKSRNLFAGGMAANYARSKITNRTEFKYTETGMTWDNSIYDFLMTTEGVENGEVRFINSFTDRYAPVESVGDRELFMKQPAWANQLIGYDRVDEPNADFGVYVQNILAFLTDGGEYFFDSENNKVYYKPLEGQDMESIDAYLGLQEALVAIGGTLDDPAHDIVFSGFTFVSAPRDSSNFIY